MGVIMIMINITNMIIMISSPRPTSPWACVNQRDFTTNCALHWTEVVNCGKYYDEEEEEEEEDGEHHHHHVDNQQC